MSAIMFILFVAHIMSAASAVQSNMWNVRVVRVRVGHGLDEIFTSRAHIFFFKIRWVWCNHTPAGLWWWLARP